MHERARAVSATPGRGHPSARAAGPRRRVRVSFGRPGLPARGANATLHGAGFGALRRSAVWRARAGVATVSQRGVLAPVAHGRAVSAPQRQTEWVTE